MSTRFLNQKALYKEAKKNNRIFYHFTNFFPCESISSTDLLVKDALIAKKRQAKWLIKYLTIDDVFSCKKWLIFE